MFRRLYVLPVLILAWALAGVAPHGQTSAQPGVTITGSVVDAALSLKAFFTTRQDALLTEIRTKAALDKDLEAKLQAACEAWKSSYSA